MRTFATEDKRKTKLFDAWIAYLVETHAGFGDLDDCNFEAKYEGIVDIVRISKKNMDLKLEDGRTLRHISINQKIFETSLKSDSMYVILGLLEGKWRVLDIISIGSIINPKKGEVHFTFNPVHVDMINAGASVAPTTH